MSGGEGPTLEYTPTWVVAAVCSLIVAISLAVERLLHFLGEYLKKKQQKPLFEALQKVKEELMLLGFISLLLTVSQDEISKICVPKSVISNMLPCKLTEAKEKTSHFQRAFTTTISGTVRRLLAEKSSSQKNYCATKHMVPLLSLQALHHLHIFIFILAIVHVTFCVITVLFGGAKIRQWKPWEDSVAKENFDPEQVLKKKVTHVQQHACIREHFLGGWLQSFFKQCYGSVTKSDYMSLRQGFIMTHCRGSPKFNFHKYMIRTLEDDFRKVVGISWYLWVFVVLFLLLNINGWHMYFWMAFLPFAFLLALGTKLEHVIIKLAREVAEKQKDPEGESLVEPSTHEFAEKHNDTEGDTEGESVVKPSAHEVAEKHIAIGGELVVKPSDDHFWFNRPGIVLILIHFILFQNAFEIAFLFWILVQYGFDSCIMGQVCYIAPRLVIGVFIQVVCSYSTLPLYAIVTQMGSSYKKAIFDEHIQKGVENWAAKVRKRRRRLWRWPCKFS